MSQKSSSWRETTIAGTAVETIFSTGWLPTPTTPRLTDDAWRDAHHRFVICVNDAVFFFLKKEPKEKKYSMHVLLGKRRIWPMPGEWMDGGAKTPFVPFEEVDLSKKLYQEYNHVFEPSRIFRIKTDATDYIWLEKPGLERHDHGHPKGILVSEEEKDMIMAKKTSDEFAGFNIYKVDDVVENEDIHPTMRHVVKDAKKQIEESIDNLLLDINKANHAKVLNHITLTIQGKIKNPKQAIKLDGRMQELLWNIYEAQKNNDEKKVVQLKEEAEVYEEIFIRNLNLRQEQFFQEL